MGVSSVKIQDKDNKKRLSVVESKDSPGKFGVVLLNPDGSPIGGPQGKPGEAATVEVGSTTTGNPGTSASVENVGSSSHAILNFTIPRGDKGETGTISVGTTTTGEAGTSASVVNVGTSTDAIFNFTIPKGDKGDTGDAATIQVGTTTTGAPGTSASVTNSGTTGAAILNFTIPRGANVSVGTTTTGQAGTNASVTNSGTGGDVILNFTIPKGDKGDTGNGISSVTSSKSGKVTTVTINFTDAGSTPYSFTVSDGEDGEGSGDVLGPNSSGNNNVVIFDGTSGKLIKDSGKLLPSVITVTLTSAGWSSNSQTVSATGVTASNTVLVAPVPADMEDYIGSLIYCTNQGSGTLTFTCDSTPTSDIVVNVVIIS